MTNSALIGREDECERLSDCLSKTGAQLIVVYGRRRIGKTFLINEYFNNNFAFKLTGANNGSRDVQLRNFTGELSRRSGKACDTPKDWIAAFEMLREYLGNLPTGEKKIVFFDEMPWMDTHKSRFLPAFEWFWNDFGSAQKNLVFIVCGSATSWMVDNIDHNKGGLFNRQTCRLYLKPFNLCEVEKFLQSKGISWSRYEIAECYMIMGGIPYYLDLLNGNYSLSQNIDRMFFKEKGSLWDEFDHLYATLFTDSENYIRIVGALSEKTGGMTRSELIEKINSPANGKLTKMLNNLVDSGFVRISGFYGKKKKDSLYQIADYYTAFYFRYIKDNYGKDEHYWSNSIDNTSRRAWTGLTFEQLCKDHIQQIKHKLGISGVLSAESVWYTKGDEESGISGAQIDLLIDRRDMVVTICEMKFSIKEYAIDKSYDMVLRNKIDSFVRTTGTRKSIQLALVTTYGLKNNMYSNIVQRQITLDDLFHDRLPV